MNFKEYCLLNQKNFDQVKSIEKQVYPSRMQTYQQFDNIEDLLDYADCDGQIDCIVKDDWYAIFCNGSTEVEVIDFASRKPLTFTELIEVRNKLQSFGDKLINMNARQSTSYRLIMAAAKRGMFEILSDEPNNEFGEPMHELILKIKPQKSFKEWLYLQEAIDAETKNLLLKAKAPKDQLDAFVKELENEPTLIDKKTAFQRFQSKFNIQKKTKDEDGQRQFFSNVPNTTEEELKTYDYYKDENPQALREMMELLRKFIDKKLITLKFENNKPVLIRNTLQGEQKFDTPDFNSFIGGLHQIRDSLKKYTGKGNYFNPMAEELDHKPNLVKGDNVWVFKGHMPDLCRIYGKGHPWCISSSSSAAHWFSYRINYHQTQYFVFDFNKDEDDPARYVNPGVAPEGMYSEWVDARNQHSVDPEDVNSNPRSHVGINGYTSINQYKKYLASKDIPLDTWKTTPPEKWEERLDRYNEENDFAGAKNDDDPRLFPMYLKIVSSMDDSDFETLDKEQKIDFVMGKIKELTNEQKYFVKTNIKRSDYYSSLQNLDDKISAAFYFRDESALEKIATMPELNYNDVRYLLDVAKDKDKMAEIIIQHRKELSNHDVKNLFHFAKNKKHIEELLGGEYYNSLNLNGKIEFAVKTNDQEKLLKFAENPELSDDNVYNLLKYANDKDEMAKLLQKDKEYISKLDSYYVTQFFSDTTFNYLDQMAKIFIKYKKELSAENVYHMLNAAKNKDEMAKLLQKDRDNISKLSDNHVFDLLSITYSSDEDQMAKIIIKYKKELSHSNVTNLLYYAKDKEHIAELLQKEEDNIGKISDLGIIKLMKSKDKDKIVQIIIQYTKELPDKNIERFLNYATDKYKDKIAEQIINKIPKLSVDNVYNLLYYANDKNHIAELLGSDNISELSFEHVKSLIRVPQYTTLMAKIINIYHQEKTPEIQKYIDKIIDHQNKPLIQRMIDIYH